MPVPLQVRSYNEMCCDSLEEVKLLSLKRLLKDISTSSLSSHLFVFKQETIFRRVADVHLLALIIEEETAGENN